MKSEITDLRCSFEGNLNSKLDMRTPKTCIRAAGFSFKKLSFFLGTQRPFWSSREIKPCQLQHNSLCSISKSLEVKRKSSAALKPTHSKFLFDDSFQIDGLEPVTSSQLLRVLSQSVSPDRLLKIQQVRSPVST